MQEKVLDIIFDQDEVTWQSMIFELVREQGMDPWDVDISVISERFLEMLRKFKKVDFQVSGKVLLAAAILLRIKSNKLVGEDLDKLNSLFAMTHAEEEELFEEMFGDDVDYEEQYRTRFGDFELTPRTPQPRKRKVSVYDLVDALQKALEVKNRRVKFQEQPTAVEVPKKNIDISVLIQQIYDEIKTYFAKNNLTKMTFKNLVKSEDAEEKIFTFMPLLYLDNQRRIELHQEEHLGDIDIVLNKNPPPLREEDSDSKKAGDDDGGNEKADSKNNSDVEGVVNTEESAEEKVARMGKKVKANAASAKKV